MTLDKVLASQYSYASGEIEHATKGILIEINNHWGIMALETDLKLIITESCHRNEDGILFESFFFHFDSTQSLVDKFIDFPEALI